MKQLKYVIGVDVADKLAKSYCLISLYNNNVEIIDCRTIYNEHEFNATVDSIIKKYNAEFLTPSKTKNNKFSKINSLNFNLISEEIKNELLINIQNLKQ